MSTSEMLETTRLRPSSGGDKEVPSEAQAALFRYIGGCYNPRRIHQGLGGLLAQRLRGPATPRRHQPQSALLGDVRPRLTIDYPRDRSLRDSVARTDFVETPAFLA